MFQRLIDDFRDSTGHALRQVLLAIGAAVALLVTTSFLCAAAFVFVLNKYGLIDACFTGAAIFFVVTLLAAGLYIARKTPAEPPAPAAPVKSAVQSALADPMLLATGLQLVRAIGLKKLIPILALGGVALGMFASRHNDEGADAADD